MTVPFDVSNDFLVFDWEDSVTYYQRNTDTSFGIGQTITHCLHREEHKDTTANDYLNADLIKQYTTWEIWSNNVEFIPIRGDKIVDTDGRTWIVETIDYCDRISRYRLRCFEQDQGHEV